MKKKLVAAFVMVNLACSFSAMAADPPIKLELVENRMIWDGAYDNSFTGMVRFKGKWYICLREALKISSRGIIRSHSVIGDGKARVIRSDGVGESINDWQWKSVAYLDYEAPSHDNWDVRDPQLTITPDGRLMLNGAAAPLDAPKERQSLVWFSKDGIDWSDGPHKIGEYNWWMWSVAWHPDGSLYGIAYGDCSSCRTGTLDFLTTRLYHSAFRAKTKSGLDFKVHVKKLTSESTEPTLVFRRDGLAVSLVRNNKSWKTGDYSHLIGVAKGDYTDWTFHKRTGVIVGGPSLIELPDGVIIAATRVINKSGHLPRGARTRLCWIDPDAREMVQLLTLPGGRPGEGGTGYPGIVWHDGHLWVSYYSGNAGRTKIYFAKVRVDFVSKNPRTVHRNDGRTIDGKAF